MEEVLSTDDISEGEVVGVTVGGEDVLLAQVDDEFYAIGDICTHEHCHLSDGWLEETEVVCPCHHAKFDVTTGEVTRPPAKEDEPSYKVMVEDGTVYIDVEK
jgi:nitrite reductase/ring-hydroxylating ferredoxin subunit